MYWACPPLRRGGTTSEGPGTVADAFARDGSRERLVLLAPGEGASL